MMFRKLPFICFLVSIIRLLTGKLRFSNEFIGRNLKLDDGEKFKIFRQVEFSEDYDKDNTSVFIVGFKFGRFSHKTNKILSIIPMLLITGFPGFMAKIYAINEKSGYWMGLYQWETKEFLDAYKKSFVLGMMKRRSISETVTHAIIEDSCIRTYLENKILEQE